MLRYLNEHLNIEGLVKTKWTTGWKEENMSPFFLLLILDNFYVEVYEPECAFIIILYRKVVSSAIRTKLLQPMSSSFSNKSGANGLRFVRRNS